MDKHVFKSNCLLILQQVHLGAVIVVLRVSIRGGGTGYITSYKLEYSLDNEIWTIVLDSETQSQVVCNCR